MRAAIQVTVAVGTLIDVIVRTTTIAVGIRYIPANRTPATTPGPTTPHSSACDLMEQAYSFSRSPHASRRRDCRRLGTRNERHQCNRHGSYNNNRTHCLPHRNKKPSSLVPSNTNIIETVA